MVSLEDIAASVKVSCLRLCQTITTCGFSGRCFITFRVTRRRREMCSGHARLCVCLCLSAAACPHCCTDPDVTWGTGAGCPPSCALLGGFAIGARVALLWQHSANAKYQRVLSTYWLYAWFVNISLIRKLLRCIAAVARFGLLLQTGVAWSDCRSVGLSVTIVNPANMVKPIEIVFGMWTRVGQRNHVLDGVQIPTPEGQFLGRTGAGQGHFRRQIYSKRPNRGQHRYGADADCGVKDGSTHCRHLANTTELSVCSGDVALCQITSTTCYCCKNEL